MLSSFISPLQPLDVAVYDRPTRHQPAVVLYDSPISPQPAVVVHGSLQDTNMLWWCMTGLQDTNLLWWCMTVLQDISLTCRLSVKNKTLKITGSYTYRMYGFQDSYRHVLDISVQIADDSVSLVMRPQSFISWVGLYLDYIVF